MNIKTIRYCFLVLAWMAQTTHQLANAQSTVYLSHLGSSADAIGADIGSDAWWAVSFVTGTAANGYSLDSMQLRTASVSGSPSGFELFLYNDNGGDPGSSLAPLIGSTPTSAGVYSFAASGITLSPSTVYWAVATSPDSSSSGNTAYWALNSSAYISNDGWSLNTSYMAYSSEGGPNSYWTHVSPGGLSLAISASPVPEPQISTLTGLGLFVFLVRRKK